MPEEENIIDAVSPAGLLEFNAELMQQFGGIKGFVTKMMDVYESPKTPASVKNQMMVFAIKIMSEANEMRGTTDYTKMSNDELIAMARKLMAKHEGKLPWDNGNG